MKYDFVLLENLYSVENHYKDLIILATLLREAGFSVAIADVFKEQELCKVPDVPHISLGIHCPRLFKKNQVYSQEHSRLKNLYYRIIKDIYLWRIVKGLKGVSSNIYLGSLTLDTPACFFSAFDKNTKYYMWALRSSVPTYWKNSDKGFYYYVSKSLFKCIQKYKNLKLIVSNDIIRNEFEINVGVERSRLLVRPERVISEKPNPKVSRSTMDGELKILYIGTIRPSKQIEFCLEAMKRINKSNILYTIAGRCREDKEYGDKINLLAASTPNVVRIDRYIPDEEYEQLLNDCDFVVLCDEKEASCASNGTMSEALLHGKPIIAPDINPFKYEVEKYGVGFLYKYGDVVSLCNVLERAIYKDTTEFVEKISVYQENFILHNVALSLKGQIECSIS